MGKKLSTLPTPAKMPSTTRLFTTGLMPYAVNPRSTSAVNASIPEVNSVESELPMTLNVNQNTRNITPKNTGNAVYFPVRILSIFTLLRCSLLSWLFTTEASTTPSINVYRISASASLRSNRVSCSISSTLCSMSSSSFWSSSSRSDSEGSPSINLVAQKRGETPIARA